MIRRTLGHTVNVPTWLWALTMVFALAIATLMLHQDRQPQPQQDSSSCTWATAFTRPTAECTALQMKPFTYVTDEESPEYA